ncbi:MAG: zinc-binding dehydrogenase [Clostridiales bacterium]|nr:zinc-binding dehydrogenase [Clostridiales bacterium]
MKYQGLIYNGQKYFTVEEMEMPEVGDNDIIVKNLVASICGSDTDTWLNGGEMHYLPPHTEFGHEVVCEIAYAGRNVTDLKVGDRIAPYPIKATPNPRKAGYLGGFSEYIYITNAKEDYNLWKLDDRISNKEAAIIEPLSVAAHGADTVKDVTDKTVVMILGAGVIGFGVAARLVDRGLPFGNITFVDRSEYRLELMRKQGFHAVNSSEKGWEKKACECTGSAYCVYGMGSAADYIFDCAGSMEASSIEPTLLEQAMRILKLGGTMVMLGVHRRNITVNAQKMVFGLQNMVCGSGFAEPDFRNVIRMLTEKKLDFEGVVTHVFPFEKIREAILFACDTNHCMRVEIDYTGKEIGE